jgi:hypothetical protein
MRLSASGFQFSVFRFRCTLGFWCSVLTALTALTALSALTAFYKVPLRL